MNALKLFCRNDIGIETVEYAFIAGLTTVVATVVYSAGLAQAIWTHLESMLP